MSRIFKLAAGAFIGISLLTTGQTGAAAQSQVPASADPTRASQRFQSKPQPQQLPDSFGYQAPAQANSAAVESFILGGVVLRGLTRFSSSDLEFLYASLIGKRLQRDDIIDLSQRITDFYVQRGYPLASVTLPKQRLVDNSQLIMDVSEGRIGSIIFPAQTPDPARHPQFYAHIEALRSETPLTKETLDRHLLLLNDIAGHIVRVILRPSKQFPGASDMLVYTHHAPFEATLSTDNRGSRLLGPWQHTARLDLNGLLGTDEHLTLRTVNASPYAELSYYDLQYQRFLNTHGTQLLFSGSHVKSIPGESLKSLNVQSKASFAQLRLVQSLKRTRTHNIAVRLSSDLRNTSTDIAQANLTDDRIRSLRGGISLDRSGDNSASILDVEYSQGISGLGSTDNGSGRSSEFGKHGYRKLTLDATHYQPIDGSISVLISSSGQLAMDSLLSSEQFAIGGPSYGSAYDPGEISGDHALAGKIELRYDTSMNDPLMDSVQLYGFYDIGSTWRRQTQSNEKSKLSLSSAGVGMRAEMGRHVSVNLELAMPLTRDLASDRDNHGRIYGGLTVRY
ncbi:MAG: ShlB/FhaC/HecB family hemolysin secretion/activation protein [Alphaproteobacteria bacterium]|nr:ShlB/FhaC/HecB family hemolysin secretion/activation protein [Alphaproteobacteria bacterium]